jgi:hypothetical protein
MHADLKNTTINSANKQPGGCDGQWWGQARAVRGGGAGGRGGEGRARWEGETGMMADGMGGGGGCKEQNATIKLC